MTKQICKLEGCECVVYRLDDICWKHVMERRANLRFPKYFRGDYGRFPSMPCQNAVCIPLNQDRHTLVDAEDFERIGHYRWTCAPEYRQQYVTSEGVRLHRMLMNAPEEMMVDHINGNIFDNRRSNLRLATRSQNLMNAKPHYNNESGYKGVTRDKNSWSCRIAADGKRYHIGTFPTPEDAAMAYNLAALKYHGEFARLNHIGEPTHE